MAASGDDDFDTPTAEYRDDPKRPDTYVYVGLDIKGLKKNFTGKAASNADIKLEMEDGEPNSQWFAVTVNLHFKDGKTKKFRYHVKRLPAAVVTDRKKSYFRVRKDNVDIYLQKAVNGRWASTLDSIGLDQAPN